jgi:alpha-galactosidase
MKNRGADPLSVKWFPAWSGNWAVSDGAKWARWWRSLEFQPSEADLTTTGQIKLGSRLHSSDTTENGVNPYWIIGTNGARLYFGLQWCGGWDTKLEGTADGKGLAFSIRLPPDETQLELKPGDTVDGPAVLITPTNELDEINNRAAWMAQRRALAHILYGGPLPSFPLTYNHWYATRFDVDPDFLNRQLEAMAPYSFDAFTVDAGWYDLVGNWIPNAEKFKPDEFEGIMRTITDNGVRAGIWSCPQFVSPAASSLPEKLEDPPVFERIIGGYLLNLAEADFTPLLTSHVATLRDRYSAGWWKYDQAFFAEQSNAGAMKNVVAFQQALRSVRRLNPDLTIENCQSGGRMINELTLLATQTSWLKDGDGTGIDHARENLGVALGALEFIFPWAVYRFTNNFDQMDPRDEELTRFYCRSAMTGIWGISSDLAALKNRQRTVILKEIENYRLLTELKRTAGMSLGVRLAAEILWACHFMASSRRSQCCSIDGMGWVHLSRK